MQEISEKCLKCLKGRHAFNRCKECQSECAECYHSCNCYAYCEDDYSEGYWDENYSMDMSGLWAEKTQIEIPDYKNNPAFQFKEGERVGQCQKCKNSMQFCLCEGSKFYELNKKLNSGK